MTNDWTSELSNSDFFIPDIDPDRRGLLQIETLVLVPATYEVLG